LPFTGGAVLSEVSEYHISLRFFGDDLDPDVVSSLLGAQPTTCCRKGDLFRGKVSERIEKTGKWLLQLPEKPGESFEPQITALLGGLTQDLAIWRELTKKYSADLFCGVWLGTSNQGMELSPRLMTQLAERGLYLGLDIYERDKEDIG
jgi:hypothetical protein